MTEARAGAGDRPVVVRALSVEMLAVLLAQRLAAEIRGAVRDRGRAVVGLSGGSTPWAGYAGLADQAVPWDDVELVQVDERIAPDGDPDRNATGLADHLPAPALARLHPMPVDPPDPGGYGRLLGELAGRPVVLDAAVLGVGADGHTASLVPGDPVVEIVDAPVALSGVYEGRRRMTLTLPVLQRARRLIVVATGVTKRDAVRRMLAGDGSIPAGRLTRARLMAIVDGDALA